MGMEIENMDSNSPYIKTVQQEYAQIDRSWLQLHYKVSVGLVIFSFFIELVIGFFLLHTPMVTTTPRCFLLKFLIIPSGINFLSIAAGRLIMKSDRIPQIKKIYLISLIFVFIGFILFTAHIAFTSIYFIFTIAIVLTTFYADYYVTGITAAASIASIIISELFIKWDADKVTIFQSAHRLGDFLISLSVLFAFSMVCMVVINFERRKISANIQKEIKWYQLQESVMLDEMTGIYNRKSFTARLKDLEDNEPGMQYILAVVDIDNFKSINDTWGHLAGDKCLVEFSKILKTCCAEGIPFRYGGDEFCLLFCGVSLEIAEAVCREIQVRTSQLFLEDYPALKMTASFGLAKSSDQPDTMKLFTHADYALYEAKRFRNAIHIF